jgi:hypothetical protein
MPSLIAGGDVLVVVAVAIVGVLVITVTTFFSVTHPDATERPLIMPANSL